MRRANTLPFAAWIVMSLFLTIFAQGALFLTILVSRSYICLCLS